MAPAHNRNDCPQNPGQPCMHGDRIDEIAETVADIRQRLFVGNGQPALATRLDRLEVAQEQRSKHFWALYPLVLGAIISAAAALWQAHQQPQPQAQPVAKTH